MAIVRGPLNSVSARGPIAGVGSFTPHLGRTVYRSLRGRARTLTRAQNDHQQNFRRANNAIILFTDRNSGCEGSVNNESFHTFLSRTDIEGLPLYQKWRKFFVYHQDPDDRGPSPGLQVPWNFLFVPNSSNLDYITSAWRFYSIPGASTTTRSYALGILFWFLNQLGYFVEDPFVDNSSLRRTIDPVDFPAPTN